MRKSRMEDLAVMPDDEFFALLYRMKRNISGAQKRLERTNHRDDRTFLSDIEVEMCYIQREAEIREKRRTIHSEYLSSLRKKFAVA
jgi:hypothetical protein